MMQDKTLTNILSTYEVFGEFKNMIFDRTFIIILITLLKSFITF